MWPEQDKLYSHDTEVICLYYCDMLTIIASAYKARDIDKNFIRLWSYSINHNETDANDTDNMMVHDNVNSWELIYVLKHGHKYTIVTTSCTKCGNYLASFIKNNNNNNDDLRLSVIDNNFKSDATPN